MTDAKFLAALGSNIRQLRKTKGITQQYLADRCGFDKANMSRIEAGRTNITVLTLKRISTELDMPIVTFFNSRH